MQEGKSHDFAGASTPKPRVMSLAVFNALVGLLIAPGHLDPLLGAVAILAIAAGRWTVPRINAVSMNIDKKVQSLQANSGFVCCPELAKIVQ